MFQELNLDRTFVLGCLPWGKNTEHSRYPRCSELTLSKELDMGKGQRTEQGKRTNEEVVQMAVMVSFHC